MPYAPPTYRPTAQPKRANQAGRPSHQRHVKNWMQSVPWLRYYEWFWQQEKNSTCTDCGCDLMELGSKQRVLDHTIPHRGDAGLFWDQGNHSARCARCHNRKTGKGM